MPVAFIPPETWIAIFSYAVWIPGVFCTSDYLAITAFAKDRHGTTVQARARQSMKTKLAISLVSSSWHTLIEPSLFKYVTIYSGNQAIHIATLLEKPDCEAHGRGWWTTRLEIDLDGIQIWTKDHADALLSIVRHCPNLVCFSNAHSTADPSLYFSPALICALGESSNQLKRVEIKGCDSPMRSLVATLADSLEVLWLVPSRRPDTGQLESWSCTLPRLHILINHLGIFERHFSVESLELPSLRVLVTTYFSDFLLLAQRTGMSIYYLGMTDQTALPQTLSLSQNLQTLVTSYYQISSAMADRHKLKHQTLQHVIIEDAATSIFTSDPWPHHHSERAPTDVLDVLSPFNFPALKTVRFYSSTRSPQEPFAAFWKWHETCTQQGIRVERCEGFEARTADEWQSFKLQEEP